MNPIRCALTAVLLAAFCSSANSQERIAESAWQESRESWKTIRSKRTVDNYRKWAVQCAWEKAWHEWQKVDNWQKAKQWFSLPELQD